MFDKKERIKKIAKCFLLHSNQKMDGSIDYQRACDLIKADITTSLVYEFDSLQGEIGSIYASLDDEPEEIAESIYQHYLACVPRGQKCLHLLWGYCFLWQTSLII